MENKIAKVKIDVNTGVLEIEGSEAFVSKYMDEFKDKIKWSTSARKDVPMTIDEPHKVATAATSPAASIKKKVSATSPKQVRAESFEVKPDGATKLEDYFIEKGSPSQHARRIAIIGYFITDILGKDFFTDGNIEFAYKVLKLNRPKFVRQACTDAKNQQQYLEVVERGEGEISAWSLSRLGQIYVEDEAKATN